MRTLRGLFPRLCDPDHLERSAARTVRGKRRRADVAWFLFRREAELERLRAELVAGTYRPEGCERLVIRDPKPRLITRIPIADRVVHTALVLLMEPPFLALPGTGRSRQVCVVGRQGEGRDGGRGGGRSAGDGACERPLSVPGGTKRPAVGKIRSSGGKICRACREEVHTL